MTRPTTIQGDGFTIPLSPFDTAKEIAAAYARELTPVYDDSDFRTRTLAGKPSKEDRTSDQRPVEAWGRV